MRALIKILVSCSLVLGCVVLLSSPAVATAELSDLDRHAKMGIQHGQRGFIHFQEMIAQLQYIQKNRVKSADSKQKDEEIALALRHAQQAFVHYVDALRIAGQSLGFFDRSTLTKHNGAPHEESEGVTRKEVFKPIPMPVRPGRPRAGGPVPRGEGS